MSRLLCVAICVCVAPTLMAADKAPPQAGEKAKDFELPAVGGRTVKLSEELKDGPAVVVVLRGFPGYQCPICRRQVSQFFDEAPKFDKADAGVLMIYPGDVDDLAAKAKEFLGTKKLPEGFQMLLDPGYTFTKAWNLRWDAANETAYPATFLVGKDMTIEMAHVSESHGDRTAPAAVLQKLTAND